MKPPANTSKKTKSAGKTATSNRTTTHAGFHPRQIKYRTNTAVLMNNHEQSRAAFEATLLPGTCERSKEGFYHSWARSIAWEAWCKALDYANTQRTEWMSLPAAHQPAQ